MKETSGRLLSSLCLKADSAMRSDKVFRSLCLRPSLDLENSLGQRQHNFSVQPAPLFDCPWGPRVSSYIKVDSVLFQVLAIISYPPSMFVSCLTLMFSSPPHKYLGAAVRPPKFPACSASLHRISTPSWNSLQFASASHWAGDSKLGPDTSLTRAEERC